MRPLLEAVSVSVHVGKKRLLEEVSLSFEHGQTVALVGPNGAGKSTFLRALAGELRPQSGHVRLLGRDVTSYSPQLLARHRAVLSQRNNIAFAFTVADVVRMGISDQRRRAVDALVDAAFAELDMIDLADRVITTLSGGEQQRAHFARALVQLASGQEAGGSGSSSSTNRRQVSICVTSSTCWTLCGVALNTGRLSSPFFTISTWQRYSRNASSFSIMAGSTVRATRKTRSPTVCSSASSRSKQP